MICRSYPLTSAKSYGKCKYKKLGFDAYGEESGYAKEMESRISLQKSLIQEMFRSGKLLRVESLTDIEVENIVKTAKVVELRHL